MSGEWYERALGLEILEWEGGSRSAWGKQLVEISDRNVMTVPG